MEEDAGEAAWRAGGEEDCFCRALSDEALCTEVLMGRKLFGDTVESDKWKTEGCFEKYVRRHDKWLSVPGSPLGGSPLLRGALT